METRIRFRAASAGLLCILAGACTDRTIDAPLPPLITSVTLDSLGSAIAIRIAASRPGTVVIDYWDDPGTDIQFEAPVGLDPALIHFPALHGSSHYHYVVSQSGRDVRSANAIDGEFDSPPLPSDLASVRFSAAGSPTMPVTMLELYGKFKGWVAVDAAGRPVWWWRSQGVPQGFTRRPNGNFIFNDNPHGIFEVDPTGAVVHSMDVTSAGPIATMTSHDVLLTAANTVLFIGKAQRSVADSTLTGDEIWEWTPENGALVRRWSAFDFFDPAVDFGSHSTATDWLHANSLAYGDHGNVILSLNWLDQVLSLSPDFSRIEWRVGGRRSDFAFADSAGFQGQHTAQVLPNGHLLMFDDGRDRAAPAHYSRGLELALDTAAHVARHVWSFRTSPDTYAPYMGSARRLANGNTVVEFPLQSGAIGASGPLAAYEVRADKTVVWRLEVSNLGGLGAVYRATPLESVAGEIWR